MWLVKLNININVIEVEEIVRIQDSLGGMTIISFCFQSVFRNYDHDHDGYISQEDFESIAANFPFLDSFCVLDKDQ